MSAQDPTRLASLVEQRELSGMLRSAQTHLPDDATVARLAGRLGFGAPGGGGTPRAPAPSTTPLGVVTPVKAVGAVVAIAGAGLVAFTLLRSGNMDGRGAPRSESRTAKTLAAATPSVETAPPGTVAPPVEAPEKPAPSPAVAATGSVVASRSAPSIAKPSETELVGDARRALPGDASRALRLTSEHAKLYPRGALAEEREVIAIEALAALGRKGEARARAQRLLSASPGTPYAPRIARAIGSADPFGSSSAPADDQKSSPPSKKAP
jgi:hypothetical protein